MTRASTQFTTLALTAACLATSMALIGCDVESTSHKTNNEIECPGFLNPIMGVNIINIIKKKVVVEEPAVLGPARALFVIAHNPYDRFPDPFWPFDPDDFRWLVNDKEVGRGLEAWIAAPDAGEHRCNLEWKGDRDRHQRTVPFKTGAIPHAHQHP